MILFIRHGETIWGQQRKNQGALDSPLTKRGVQQNEINKAILSRLISFSDSSLSVYISPSKRSMDTFIQIFGQPAVCRLVIEERIRAVSAGSWDGCSFASIHAEHPDVPEKGWQFFSIDGEKYNQAAQRAQSFLADISTPAVIISHGLIGRVLFGEYLHYDYENALDVRIRQDAVYRFSNHKITELDLDGEEKQLSKLY